MALLPDPEDSHVKATASLDFCSRSLSGRKNIVGAKSQQRNDDVLGCGTKGDCPSLLSSRRQATAHSTRRQEDKPGPVLVSDPSSKSFGFL